MSAPKTFRMEFYDQVTPSIPAGNYEVVVGEEVEIAGMTYLYSSPQSMTVGGPHIALDPSDVVSVYPPYGSESDYSEALAHVVLNHPALPWEINPSRGSPTVAPWMMLLLFKPEEILWPHGANTSPGTGTGVQTVELRDYFTPPATVLAPALLPAEKDSWFELFGDHVTVNVIDVALDVFTAIAPRFSELPLLAHVRKRGGTEYASTADTDGSDRYSVIVGNRLSNTAGMFIAHLVSVEGFADYLPGSGVTIPPGKTSVRLLSLASWTFNTMPGPDLKALMRNLSVDVLRLPQSLEPIPPSPLVQAALDSGYTALEYQTRSGETTTAWYRGPCLPVQIAPNPQPTYSTADAALLYDRDNGMFDVSFAVAWQTGRLLALANRQFVTSLLEWIDANNSIQRLLVERLDFSQDYEFLDPPAEASELLAPDAILRLLRRFFATKLAPHWTEDQAGGTPPLGPACDPSGLRRDAPRLRGMLTSAEVEALIVQGMEPNAAVVDAVRTRGTRS